MMTTCLANAALRATATPLRCHPDKRVRDPPGSLRSLVLDPVDAVDEPRDEITGLGLSDKVERSLLDGLKKIETKRWQRLASS